MLRRLLSIGVSLGIIAVIFSQVSVGRLGEIFLQSNAFLIVFAFSMFIPMMGVLAWRFWVLIPESMGVSLRESLRLVLMAQTLNLVLPSKMGDVAKAYFLKVDHGMKPSHGVSLVLFEKILDMLSVFFWGVVGIWWFSIEGEVFRLGMVLLIGFLLGFVLVVSPGFTRLFFRTLFSLVPRSVLSKFVHFYGFWRRMQRYLLARPLLSIKMTVLSVMNSLLNLVQLWLLIVSVGGEVPFFHSIVLTTFGVIAGLFPFTFAGVGTRDAAFIYFYLPYFDAATGAAFGLLASARYVFPALAGLPFMGRYLGLIKKRSI